MRGFTDGVDEANGKEQKLEMGLDGTGLDRTGLVRWSSRTTSVSIVFRV